MPTTSIFSYPLTRRYPPKFTWIICAGGVILLTLFTFIAVAGNAYQAESIYTPDLNGTQNDKQWFQKRPFTWAAEIETTCQPSFLTIGDTHMTTNGGFRYTIDSFGAEGNSSDVPFTVAYWNTTLRDCQVKQVEIQLLSSAGSAGTRNWWTWEDTFARSTAECWVYSDSGQLRVNLTHQMLPLKQRDQFRSSFASLNSSTHPGRWLGAQIVRGWYGRLESAMAYSAPRSSDSEDTLLQSVTAWTSGTITLTRTNLTDYTSFRFFACDFSMMDNAGGLKWIHPPSTIQEWRDQWDPVAMANAGRDTPFGLPNVSTIVDVFSKAYYFLLLSDLNAADEDKSANALSTEHGLEYLQSVNSTETVADKLRSDRLSDPHAKIDKMAGSIPPVFHSDATNLTQPLATPDYTTFVFQYLCTKPIRKSTFKLIFAVVLADIVFLSACWTVFGWVATWWLQKRDTTTEHCAGCLDAAQDVPLTSLASTSKSGSYSRVSESAREEQEGSSRVL
ncbi:hypothetical protein Q7P37_003587 [Cladosporium fusiforme]